MFGSIQTEPNAVWIHPDGTILSPDQPQPFWALMSTNPHQKDEKVKGEGAIWIIQNVFQWIQTMNEFLQSKQKI